MPSFAATGGWCRVSPPARPARGQKAIRLPSALRGNPRLGPSVDGAGLALVGKRGQGDPSIMSRLFCGLQVKAC